MPTHSSSLKDDNFQLNEPDKDSSVICTEEVFLAVKQILDAVNYFYHQWHQVIRRWPFHSSDGGKIMFESCGQASKHDGVFSADFDSSGQAPKHSISADQSDGPFSSLCSLLPPKD